MEGNETVRLWAAVTLQWLQASSPKGTALSSLLSSKLELDALIALNVGGREDGLQRRDAESLPAERTLLAEDADVVAGPRCSGRRCQ